MQLISVKRGKTRASKWRLVLVQRLIGWESGASFFAQWSKTKANTILIQLETALYIVCGSNLVWFHFCLPLYKGAWSRGFRRFLVKTVLKLSVVNFIHGLHCVWTFKGTYELNFIKRKQTMTISYRFNVNTLKECEKRDYAPLRLKTMRFDLMTFHKL